MFSFGSGNKPVLGIDIGTSSIKIVELKLEGETPVLSNYAWASFDDGSSVRNDPTANFIGPIVPSYIKSMLSKAGIKSKDAYVSIPAFGGLITLIDFPEMPTEDMEQAIKFEAHKYIPTSLDDVVISWDVVGKRGESKNVPDLSNLVRNKDASLDAPKEGPKMLEILLVAASKSRVANYENIINSSGLDLRSIDIETFPLVRSLIGNDPGNFIIVDIGSRACNIVLVEKGSIKINRNIDAGGKDLTRIISRSMQIDYERAEDMKVSGNDFFSKDSYVNFSTLDSIINEVSRTIRSHYKDDGVSSVNGIILSGGTAGLTGISEYFQERLKIPTSIGDPFKRVGCDSEVESVLQGSKTRFSVSVGLALKGIEERIKNKK